MEKHVEVMGVEVHAAVVRPVGKGLIGQRAMRPTDVFVRRRRQRVRLMGVARQVQMAVADSVIVLELV